MSGARPREVELKYLVLLAGEPGVGPIPGSDEFVTMLTEFRQVTGEMAAAGVLVDSGPLQDASAATTVRVRDGQRIVADGPFAETQEQIGGYYVLDCTDLDAAIEWVARIPSARYGSLEIRPMLNVEMLS